MRFAGRLGKGTSDSLARADDGLAPMAEPSTGGKHSINRATASRALCICGPPNRAFTSAAKSSVLTITGEAPSRFMH